MEEKNPYNQAMEIIDEIKDELNNLQETIRGVEQEVTTQPTIDSNVFNFSSGFSNFIKVSTTKVYSDDVPEQTTRTGTVGKH
ncbi:MAG TPA: hypothetical protein V6C58_04575 [Allocoleopsis sp.]